MTVALLVMKPVELLKAAPVITEELRLPMEALNPPRSRTPRLEVVTLVPVGRAVAEPRRRVPLAMLVPPE